MADEEGAPRHPATDESGPWGRAVAALGLAGTEHAPAVAAQAPPVALLLRITSCLFRSVLLELLSVTCPHGSWPCGSLLRVASAVSAVGGSPVHLRWPRGPAPTTPCLLGPVSPCPCPGCLAEPQRGREADFGEARASGSVLLLLTFDSCWVGVQAGVGVGRPPRLPTSGTWHARSPQLSGCGLRPWCPPPALGCGWPWAWGRFPPVLQVLRPLESEPWARSSHSLAFPLRSSVSSPRSGS